MHPTPIPVALMLLSWAPWGLAQDVDFRRDVRPLLSDRCFACHGPDAAHREADLRLDERDSALARGAIVPGDPERSVLIHRVRAPAADERMPPPRSNKELSRGDIEVLERWIAQGARYEVHWSMAPVPASAAASVSTHALIDRSISKKLEAERVKPSPPADRRSLARRLSFDLLGLPPTSEDVQAFEQDARPDAYERLVDRLLASPHYGERMAMMWLDLVRYADTVGYHGDQEHAISPYRDWVIAAFNDDMPFDQFTVEQIAGDLLPEPTRLQKIASGYNRLLQTTHEGGAQDAEYLAIYAADRVRNVSSVWMGATIGCAQCHDHKYDPYTTKDFYRLAAFFADIEERGAFDAPNTSPTRRDPEMWLTTPEQEELLSRVDRELAPLLEESREVKRLLAAAQRATSENEPSKLEERQREIGRVTKALRDRREKILEGVRRTLITVSAKPRVTRVLARGDWMDTTGEVVEPGVPAVFGDLPIEGRRATRLDLARWLVSNGHPLAPRVLANRLWALLFGRGLSSRLDDVGAQGEAPSHGELLDALARRFLEGGQRIKPFLRELCLSETYRRASAPRPDLAARDPQNRWLARQGRWRVPAESVRDTALVVSGLLVRSVGGESIYPYQPAGYYRHLNFPRRTYREDTDERQWRRGVYMHWQRSFLHPALRAFDAPTREECTAERAISNTPSSALVLLNDPSFVEAARVLAERILARGGNDDRGRIVSGFRWVLQRSPEERELEVLQDVLAKHLREGLEGGTPHEEILRVGRSPVPEELDPVLLFAWTSVARVLLNLGETYTRS